MIDWENLLQREGAAVWRTLYRLVRNQADAEECFQETFLAALECANRQRVENWPGLLQRLATARGVDRLRKCLRRMRREEVADLALAESAEPGPAQQAETAELSAALRWALTHVPTRHAELFCLRELSDWSYQDIAEQFGMSTSAVGVTLHRARHKLQKLLKSQNQMPAALDHKRRT